MKNAILTLLFVLFLFQLSLAQDSLSTRSNMVYAELVSQNKLFSKKVLIRLDFGQEANWLRTNTFLLDKDGKQKTFNSMVDAMNFMSQHGWEFVQAYVIKDDDDEHVHWIIRHDNMEDVYLLKTGKRN